MTLHAERHGIGRPLLMVHGLGGSLRSWDPIVNLLTRSREVILIDLPGHGCSPPLSGRQSIAAFADAIQIFMRENNLDDVDMVGSSVGGRLVLELSRRGAGGHCIAFDPGGFWHGWEKTYFHRTMAASIRVVRALQPAMPLMSRHAVTRTLLMMQLSAKPWALPPDLVLTEMRSLAATPVFDAMLQELVDGPLQQGTATTPGRVTIGWGRNDRLLLPRQAPRAHAAFPNARLHWFDHCGHFPQWDQPYEAVRVIQETLAPSHVVRSPSLQPG